MSLRWACIVIFCFSAFVAGFSVSAQNSNYHLKVASDPPFPSGWVSLVNDSDRVIEAANTRYRCPDWEPLSSLSWSGDDFLTSLEPEDLIEGADGTSTHGSIYGADGKLLPTKGVEPGGRVGLGVVPRAGINKGGQECEVKVDFVIYSDGTFEGNESAVRVVKAGRDGIVAGVRYWAQVLNGMRSAGSNSDFLVEKARNRREEDQANVMNYSSSQPDTELLRQYWKGRSFVDDELVKSAKQSGLVGATIFVVGWERRFDWSETSGSMKKLNVTFPPISDPAVAPDSDSK